MAACWLVCKHHTSLPGLTMCTKSIMSARLPREEHGCSQARQWSGSMLQAALHAWGACIDRAWGRVQSSEPFSAV